MCHQRPERSFFFGCYQVPVCARCCGVAMGQLGAAVHMVLVGVSSPGVAFAGVGVMGIDWALQAVGLLESSNERRVVTGICGGLGFFELLGNFARAL